MGGASNRSEGDTLTSGFCYFCFIMGCSLLQRNIAAGAASTRMTAVTLSQGGRKLQVYDSLVHSLMKKLCR